LVRRLLECSGGLKVQDLRSQTEDAPNPSLREKLCEGFFERDGEALGEELRGAIGHDDHVVFAADAELAGDVDSWLVRKRHARLQHGLAAAY
jgi:hypothetical protein